MELGRSFHAAYQLAETQLTARRYGAARRQLRAILDDEHGEVRRHDLPDISLYLAYISRISPLHLPYTPKPYTSARCTGRAA